jgi:hypothetical protein
MLGRIVGGVIHAIGDGVIGVLRRRGDNHLLRARLEVLTGLGAIGEEAAALEHQVDPERLPGQLGGIALGQHLDGACAHLEAAVLRLHVVGERAVHGVVLQEVGQGLRVRDVVDRDEVELRLAECRAEYVAADTSETVDADTDRHAWNLAFLGAPDAGRSRIERERIPSTSPEGKAKRIADLTLENPSARRARVVGRGGRGPLLDDA